MARRLATAVLTLGCMHAGAVAALGLGELTLDSFLNEPLTATVDILNSDGLHEDQIRVRLATSDDFEKLNIDRAYFLTSIKFEVNIDENGRGTIRLSSEDPVLEPYLDFLIEARWPSGRLLREYTVLVDPPAFDTQNAVISASERVSETEGDMSSPKKKTETANASTGTQVKTHKSDLADGEMPRRDFSSNASGTPLPGDRYMIKRDETLWGIALKSKPEGTSVHQTMLDIQRLNPNAFIDGNINRIKAGYIVYLPSSSDITSSDLASAREEVRQQNQDWRDGVASTRRSTGPSLRISADPGTLESSMAVGGSEMPVSSASSVDDSAASDEGLASGDGVVSGNSTASDDISDSGQNSVELSERLTAMEQQVETLQRIVSLKDDQIAALQTALTGSEDADSATEAPLDASDPETALQMAKDAAMSEQAAIAAAEPDPSPEPAVAQPPSPAPVPKPAAEEESGSNMLSYIAGLLVIVALGIFFFLRRRGGDAVESEAASREVFAGVKLQDSDVQLNDIEEIAEPEFDNSVEREPAVDLASEFDSLPELQPVSEPEPEPEPAVESEPAADSEPKPEEAARENRGYGERKHDEYASDEAGDALAEADIYIAYGRYPQAVDLLKTAIDNEQGNPDYRVKLIELFAEMGNKDEAQQQYAQLQSIGDAGTISAAEDILRNAGSGGNWLTEVASPGGDEAAAPSATGLDLVSEMDLTTDTGEELEADFGELEIELIDSGAEEDLDLSADFAEESTSASSGDEEDLVFAEGGNEMSTKLDLARAYLDMGDEDGAKQILEEVAVEGSAGQKEEAKVLLERLD
jgi:pilus assembly protein FimV